MKATHRTDRNVTTRASKEISKVVTTCKNWRVDKSTRSTARFVRQTPSEKQTKLPNRSQSSYRARYYDPTTGEFTSRDPLEYVDGMSLMRGYFMPSNVDPEGERKVCCKYSYSKTDDSNGWVNERECGVGKSALNCCLEAQTIRKWWLHDYADKPCARRPNPTKTNASNTACCFLVIAVPKEVVPQVTVPKAVIGCAVAGVAGAYFLCCANDILDFPIEIDIAPPVTRQPKTKGGKCFCFTSKEPDWGNHYSYGACVTDADCTAKCISKGYVSGVCSYR